MKCPDVHCCTVPLDSEKDPFHIPEPCAQGHRTLQSRREDGTFQGPEREYRAWMWKGTLHGMHMAPTGSHRNPQKALQTIMNQSKAREPAQTHKKLLTHSLDYVPLQQLWLICGKVFWNPIRSHSWHTCNHREARQARTNLRHFSEVPVLIPTATDTILRSTCYYPPPT